MKNVAFVLLALLLAPPAAAHEAQLSDGRKVDYSGLVSPHGSRCCGNNDCEAVEWREAPGGILELMIPGHGWTPAPVEVMIPPHPDAPDLAHACWPRHNIRLWFYCVMPPGFGT